MTRKTDGATRRRLLVGLASGATVALAGCTDGTENGGTETAAETATETATATATATATETGTETGTETETTTAEASAQVRVGHLSPNAPNVDVYVDETAVLEDVAFGTVSSYLDVTSGTRTVTITAAGDPEAIVFEGDLSLDADRDYTVLATGEVGEQVDRPFQPIALEDDNSTPASGTARVRLVHAAPDAPTVDLTTEAGDVLFDGVSFGEVVTTEVSGGDYAVQIRNDTESNDGETVASFEVSFTAGQVYTAYAVGYLTPDDEPASTPFDVLLTQDTASSD